MSVLDSELYVIAEIANAAQGIVEDNHRIIDLVSDAGADAVKFQFYKYDELATPSYEKYENYQKTFYSEEERIGFVGHAKEVGLDVAVDVFDRWGFQLAKNVDEKIDIVKIPPTVIMDEELVESILSLNKPVLVGVGGYGDEDVDFILSKFKGLESKVVLMHGFQGFPTDERDSSLARIPYLKDKYNLPVGFADHINAESDLALRLPEYAFFSGASVIEKHITLDRSSKGLDYYSSLLPDEFKMMVANFKRCQSILGSLEVSLAEKDYLKHASRVVVVRDVNKGELIARRDVSFKRTNCSTAMYPNQWADINLAIAKKSIERNGGVMEKDLEKIRVGTVIACRMNSTRVPKKALAKINGLTTIERCLHNVLGCRLSRVAVLATSTHPDDDVLSNYTLGGRVHFFKGAETDLVQRFLDASEKYNLDVLVRVTGDRPMISSELMDILIEDHCRKGADFSCFTNVALGTNPEVISVSALHRVKEMLSTQDCEYLTSYFKNNAAYFNINEIEPPKEYRHPEYRLVLDHPEDLHLITQICESLNIGSEQINFKKVFEFLDNESLLSEVNSFIKPKYEGEELSQYLKKMTTIRD